jgi:biopolymer transport protein ExbD
MKAKIMFLLLLIFIIGCTASNQGSLISLTSSKNIELSPDPIVFHGKISLKENVSITGNLTMLSPDGTEYSCSPDNTGSFMCS